ncbi:HNH endonuclease [Citrobacter sp. Cf093]|uniref:HNH endonuclease signature motif containing protein n=1 Tax=Enterobacteriaceae TaxID=543 RepID=UPI0020198095|nr:MULTISPECIES: HNH endonuclease signature motif containing protein [Enterobacteriaceae]MEB0962868.1 HNH endonuclease signature motif containing protein [Citrobacter freundii]MCO6575882.1 HNH endonuclease [Escherichia coli]MCO6581037.1 HNH endonuclease [Escherichia coli]MCO6586518.1 HNH endonuclease [Escherichia coli]MDM3213662.1 HNH endonuclease [Citrobacter sp. Cf093]
MKTIEQSLLKESVSYDEKTGIFRWIAKRQNVVAGRIAGHKDSLGYIRITISGKNYLAHRLAWLYVHGYMPEKEIDHINRIRNDNRITNLREATSQLNSLNTGMYKNNTSGSKGIYFNKRAKKWQAQILIDGKREYLGLYDDVKRADIAFRIANHFRLAKLD